MKLLIAEDERELAAALCAIFARSNYSADAVHDGTAALDYICAGRYDGVILDVMMPGMSGLEVLTEMRRRGIGTPALLLTAKSDLNDRIAGLDAGADDYLPKPFSTDELLARVRSMLRRRDAFTPDTLVFHGMTLDRAAFELAGGGRVFPLGGKEFQMLDLLMRSRDRYLSTEQLMEQIWGYQSQAEINVVWVCVSGLRKKLAAIDPGIMIRAKRGVGYRLEHRQDAGAAGEGAAT